jgi:preprotein translocase subunit SecD
MPPSPAAQGGVLLYEIDPGFQSSSAAPDMDALVKVIDRRLNAGAEKLALVRKRDDNRVEVAPLRPGDADRQRVERLLARPGTLEFRILANPDKDKAIIERAEKDRTKTEVLDAAGRRLAWWVPERSLGEGPSNFLPRPQDIVERFRSGGDCFETLVVSDAQNITGADLTKAEAVAENKRYSVGLTLTDGGGKRLAKLTGDHLPDTASGKSYRLGIIVDGWLFSAPFVRSVIHNQGRITGNFEKGEAEEIADALNAGSLPVQLRLVPAEKATKPAFSPGGGRKGTSGGESGHHSLPLIQRTHRSDPLFRSFPLFTTRVILRNVIEETTSV